MTTTLEQSNATIREAVTERMAATPADDPKMVGYKIDQGDPEPVPSETLDRWATAIAEATASYGPAETYAEWRPPSYATTVAERTLQAALEAVRDRHTKYGPPREHFARTAALVNAAFGTSFSPTDWALVMVLDKVARLRGPTPTTDGGVDIAGYAGCYEECRSRG